MRGPQAAGEFTRGLLLYITFQKPNTYRYIARDVMGEGQEARNVDAEVK